MADIGILPKLAGQGWSVTKTPTWQTRIQRAVSGREVRVLDYPYPLWQFALTWNVLGDNSALLPGSDLRTLMGFFLACQGAFATFLYADPYDNQVAGEPIGTGDGETAVFQLQRFFGGAGGIGFVEPVTAPDTVSLVYLNGIRQRPDAWNIDPATGLLTFTAPPLAGQAITADFTYWFRCRFVADAYGFENFMTRLWQVKKLDFISVRP